MIRVYVLNGALMPDRAAMHTHLAMQFRLPAYYGNNLDALWDCLGDLSGGVIVFQNAALAPTPVVLPLIGLLLDLCRENPAWQLELHSDFPDCHKHAAPGTPAAEPSPAEGPCAPAETDEAVECGAMEDVCPYNV